MSFKIFGIVILGLLGFISAQAQTKPCGCEDKEDLLDLLNWTQTAIQEYQFQLQSITALEQAEGKTVMYSEADYNKLWESVHNAIGAVRQKGYGVSMNTRDCSITGLETQSTCVRQFMKNLYDFNQKVCMRTLLWRNGKTESYLEQMKLRQIVVDAILAYKTAQSFILQMLKLLPQNCRPKNWFGYVVYQTVKTLTSVRNIPPRGSELKRPGSGVNIINGGSETIGSKDTYTGTILVEEGKSASAKGNATFSFNSSKTFSGRIYCSPNRPDESFVATSGINASAQGESDGNASFRLEVNPQQRKYHLSISLPFSVTVIGQSKIFGNTSGGCGSIDPNNQSGPINNKVNGVNYGINETMLADSPDYLEGTRNEKPPLLNQSTQQGNTSGTHSYEIQVKWMLRRLPPK